MLYEVITVTVLENVAKTIILTGVIVGYAYAVEIFIAWYSWNPIEQDLFYWRMFGDYTVGFWIMAICNTMVPLLFFFKKIRTDLRWLLVIS